MTDLVLLEKQEAVAVITLNRPQAMNALSRDLRDSISSAFRAIQADETVRVAVLTGAGKAFCAGFDLKELAAGAQDGLDQVAENDMAEAIDAFEGPVIAAVNGHAVTGGFELALACDLIIASTEASFADTHARVGILPGWGLSQRLPRLIGIARAKELSFSGNKIGAQLSYEWGLVNRVVKPEELLDTAIALATDMASCVPQVLMQYKILIDQGYGMTFGDGISYEARVGVESAKAATAAMVGQRKDDVMLRGRDQDQKMHHKND